MEIPFLGIDIRNIEFSGLKATTRQADTNPAKATFTLDTAGPFRPTYAPRARSARCAGHALISGLCSVVDVVQCLLKYSALMVRHHTEQPLSCVYSKMRT